MRTRSEFAAKWGDSVPQGRRVALRAFSGDGRGERVRAGFTNGFEMVVRRAMEPGAVVRVGSLGRDACGIVRLKPDLLQRARVSLDDDRERRGEEPSALP